jgi:hypothetical protein
MTFWEGIKIKLGYGLEGVKMAVVLDEGIWQHCHLRDVMWAFLCTRPPCWTVMKRE